MIECRELAWELIRRHPHAAARSLEALPATEVAAFLAETPTDLAASVVSRMTLPAAARVVAPLEAEVAASVLRATPSYVTAGALRHMSEAMRTQTLGLLPRKTILNVHILLRYSEDTVGAWMEPRIHVLAYDVTAEGAVERLKQSTERKAGQVYVVDRDGRLRGTLDVWDLMVAAPDAKISVLTRRQLRTLAATTHLQQVADHPGWSDVDEMPIVSSDGRLVGALRHVNLVRALRTRFPEQDTTGIDDVALELTGDVWDGMSRFLETIAAIPNPSADHEKGQP